MDRAKIFKNGDSQAVPLPKEYRFTGKEVYIHRERGNDPKESVIECNKIKRVGCFKLREWLKPNEKL